MPENTKMKDVWVDFLSIFGMLIHHAHNLYQLGKITVYRLRVFNLLGADMSHAN